MCRGHRAGRSGREYLARQHAGLETPRCRRRDQSRRNERVRRASLGARRSVRERKEVLGGDWEYRGRGRDRDPDLPHDDIGEQHGGRRNGRAGACATALAQTAAVPLCAIVVGRGAMSVMGRGLAMVLTGGTGPKCTWPRDSGRAMAAMHGTGMQRSWLGHDKGEPDRKQRGERAFQPGSAQMHAGQEGQAHIPTNSMCADAVPRGKRVPYFSYFRPMTAKER